MKNLICPVCKSRSFQTLETEIIDFEYGAPGTFSWELCSDCGVIQLHPLPTGELLALAYPDNYHAYLEPKSNLTRFLIEKSRSGMAKKLARLTPPKGSILDIGCSTGALLAATKEHGDFQLYGVEFKPEAAQTARSRGINVWNGELENADFPEKSMNLIVMQHVLEHVFDPMKTLDQSFRLLKQDGTILGELPNYASWDAQIFGRFWGGGHAPRHIWHFTPNSLRQTLEKAGFVDVQITPALHTGHWALSFQNYFRRHCKGIEGLVNGRTWYYPFFLLFTLPVNVIQYFINKTGVMRFQARRP